MRCKPIVLVVKREVYDVTVYDTEAKRETIVRLLEGQHLEDKYLYIRKDLVCECKTTYRMPPGKFMELSEDVDIEFIEIKEDEGE